MPEEKKPELIPVRSTVKAADHKYLYVNSSRMGISPYDIRMVVGQVVESPEGQINEDHVTIIMSPQHTKAFLRSLQNTVVSYEEHFGEIKDPRDAFPKAEGRDAKPQAKATKKPQKSTKN